MDVEVLFRLRKKKGVDVLAEMLAERKEAHVGAHGCRWKGRSCGFCWGAAQTGRGSRSGLGSAEAADEHRRDSSRSALLTARPEKEERGISREG